MTKRNGAEFKIEKGVPIPEHGNRRFPFAQMEVGDSVFIAVDDPFKLASRQASVLTGAKNWARYNNKDIKFTSKKDGHGFRIWRIK